MDGDTVNERLVANVSDTACWVAVYRAWESERPDALFHDPYAGRLAGEHGRAIADMMPRQARNGWPIIVRTRLIDDLVFTCVAEGCDCVINLAAGLDTRPYRMMLPPTLQWIEVDLPALILKKNRLMAEEVPVCQLSRQAVDVTDPQALGAFLDEVASKAQRILVIAEGLLLYLDESVVSALSRELFARETVRWWVMELASPGVLKMMEKEMGDRLANAPLKFASPDGVAFFEKDGWKAREIHAVFQQAGRMNRLPWFMQPFSYLPAPNPRKLGNAPWSGVIRFGRQPSAPADKPMRDE
jgi:methyltransferase (TIGR00027 family)